MKYTKNNITPYNTVYAVELNDLNQFSKNQLNRNTNINHVNEIKRHITDDNWKDFAPIEVNIKTMNIVDGQHRYSAFTKYFEENPDTKAKLRVIFIEKEPSEELELIKNKNTHTKNWATTDFAESAYQSNDCSEITTLFKFCDEHEKCHSVRKGNIRRKLEYGSSFLWGKPMSKQIRTKDFCGHKIKPEDYKAADARYKQIDKIVERLKLTSTSTWYARLAQAWYKLTTNVQYADIIKNMGLNAIYDKIEKNPPVQQFTAPEQWVDYFETKIFN